MELIKTIDFFGLDDIKKEGIEIISRKLDTENAIEVYRFSDLYSNILLKEQSQTFILKNFEVVSKMKVFVNLDIDSLKDILSSNILLCGAEKMFAGVLRWIAEDFEQRKSNLMELCRLIRFGHADIMVVVRIATIENILTSIQYG